MKTQFTPLVLAISSVIAASHAEEISAGTTAFEAIYVGAGLILATIALLLVGPLLVFVSQLAASRGRSIIAYMVFAARYLKEFEVKWVRAGADPEDAPWRRRMCSHLRTC